MSPKYIPKITFRWFWLLPLFDIAAIIISIFIAYFLRFDKVTYQSVFINHTGATLMFPLVIMFYLFLFDCFRPRESTKDIRIYVAPLIAMVLSAITLGFLYYFIPHWKYGRSVFAFAFIILVPLIVLNRVIFNKFAQSKLATLRVYFVGTSPSMQYLLASLKNQPFYKLGGYFAESPKQEFEREYNIPYLGTPSQIREFFGRDNVVSIDESRNNGSASRTFKNQVSLIESHGSSTSNPEQSEISQPRKILDEHKRSNMVITFDNETMNDPRYRHELLRCLAEGYRIQNMTNFYERTFGKIPIQHTNDEWILHVHGFTVAENAFMVRVQRLMDIGISLVILVLSSPIMLLAALAIKLTSSGPVIFRQTRCGLYCEPFTILKFRTMYKDAESQTGAVWANPNKDPRVTPVGRILRRTRIDELPQLINVLVGEMSLIGPRPERPEFVYQLEKQIPFYFLRFAVRPGITGWAQVMFRYGASVEDSAEKLQYDLFYIKNRNIWLNLYIILKTVQTVLLKPGS